MANFQIYQHPKAMKKFAILVNMFKELSEYTKYLMQENTDYGLPLQRPLFLHYEDDRKSYDISYQYLYGSDLLVAPVLKPGRDKRQVYLPPDKWVHLFTGVTYTGGESVEVPAPIGMPPVFYREQSIWKHTFRQVANIARNGLQNVKQEL